MKPYILEEYKNGRRYFEDIDVMNEVFDNENLEGIIFEHSGIYASFKGANLRNAQFLNGGIKTCDFRGADLTNAKFEFLCIESSAFLGANVEGVYFNNNSCYGQDATQAHFNEFIKDFDA